MSTAYQVEKRQYQQLYLKSSSTNRSGQQEEIRTTPLFTLAVKHTLDSISPTSIPDSSSTSSGEETSDEDDTFLPALSEGSSTSPRGDSIYLPQHALLGFHCGDDNSIGHQEPIMLNLDAPHSAFICGSQGSGKSYTLSCMLENFLVSGTETGNNTAPVAGVVFHYDTDSSASIAEVAHLCSRGIPVKVLVSQSNQRALNAAYGEVGARYGNLTVEPLLLRSSNLSIDRMNKLMALAEKEGPLPLYMEVIQRILREMAIVGSAQFNYKKFRQLLRAEDLTKDQTGPMNLRFGLLESFMHPDDIPESSGFRKPGSKLKSASCNTTQKLFELEPGTLTIVDLSDTFVDASTVCLLFDICLSIIKSQRTSCPSGLVIALDEAHKFMNTSNAAKMFTERLLTTIREQRHNATRVIIATQEPTIDPRLLDLCSMSVVHRFTSPAWFSDIKGHLGGASSMVSSNEEQCQMFERIVELDVGESLVFSPSAFVQITEMDRKVKKLGAQVVKMKTRARLGADGGMSVLASEVRKTMEL